MIAAEVQFYEVTVFFHISAVVLAFGPSFAYGVLFATAAKTNPAALPTIARAVLIWGRTAGRLGMVVILASGIYLVSDRWEWADFFVSWGMAAIIGLLALSELYFNPSTRKFIDACEAGRDGEVQAIAARQSQLGPLAGIIVILTIYVMTAKPFL